MPRASTSTVTVLRLEGVEHVAIVLVNGVEQDGDNPSVHSSYPYSRTILRHMSYYDRTVRTTLAGSTHTEWWYRLAHEYVGKQACITTTTSVRRGGRRQPYYFCFVYIVYIHSLGPPIYDRLCSCPVHTGLGSHRDSGTLDTQRPRTGT